MQIATVRSTASWGGEAQRGNLRTALPGKQRGRQPPVQAAALTLWKQGVPLAHGKKVIPGTCTGTGNLQRQLPHLGSHSNKKQQIQPEGTQASPGPACTEYIIIRTAMQILMPPPYTPLPSKWGGNRDLMVTAR